MEQHQFQFIRNFANNTLSLGDIQSFHLSQKKVLSLNLNTNFGSKHHSMDVLPELLDVNSP